MYNATGVLANRLLCAGHFKPQQKKKETTMSFIIEATHKKTGERRYICAVPVDNQECEFENALVDTLDEAVLYPYQFAEAAAAVIGTFPRTKNLEYEVIEVAPQNAFAAEAVN
jgi:hypothetical protein